ncbi:MAG TPA: hypothetical protein PLN22_00230 [Ignavibacteria bacterium]|nr:hypothetical protein [Ignavibacteria bacterium]
MPPIKYTNLKPLEPRNCFSEINTREHNYDMHNMADFLESKYNTESQIVELIWKYPSKWFLENKNEYKDNIQYLKENDIIDKVRLIALIFKGVTRYEVKPRDPEMPFTEDNCLTQILTYDEDFKQDALLFEFQGGLKITIEAEEVIFERDYKIKY